MARLSAGSSSFSFFDFSTSFSLAFPSSCCGGRTSAGEKSRFPSLEVGSFTFSFNDMSDEHQKYVDCILIKYYLSDNFYNRINYHRYYIKGIELISLLILLLLLFYRLLLLLLLLIFFFFFMVRY